MRDVAAAMPKQVLSRLSRFVTTRFHAISLLLIAPFHARRVRCRRARYVTYYRHGEPVTCHRHKQRVITPLMRLRYSVDFADTA